MNLTIAGSSRTMELVLLIACLAALAIGGSATYVGADDGAFYGAGSTVYATKENRVRMEKEVVIIRYNREAAGTLGKTRLKRWLADCTFTFINTTGKPVDVQMGFPDIYAHGEEVGGPKPLWTISDFKVTVGDAEVPTVHKEVRAPHEAVKPKGARPVSYQGAYTWPVHFEPRQHIVVKNTYAFGGGSSMTAVRDLIRGKQVGRVPRAVVFWRDTKPKRCEYDFNNSAFSYVHYIVTTGLTWAGPIGAADIAIEIPPNTLPHLLLPTPDAFTIRDGFVRWHFKQWHPVDEIGIYTVLPIPPENCGKDYEDTPPLFDTTEQAERWVRIAKTHQFELGLVSLVRNAYLAKYGLRFEDSQLQDFFEKQYWYRAKPDADLKFITPRDQEIMAVLERLEKNMP